MQGCVICKLHVLDACRQIVIFYLEFFLKNQILRVELSELFYPNHHKDIFNWEISILKKIWPHISLLGLHQYLLHFEHQFWRYTLWIELQQEQKFREVVTKEEFQYLCILGTIVTLTKSWKISKNINWILLFKSQNIYLISARLKKSCFYLRRLGG